jgi:hypothetical protein
VTTILLGVFFTALGIFGTAQERNPGYLVFIPVGLFSGLIGCIALDCFNYLMNKWGLKDV